MNKKSNAGLTDKFRPPATRICTGCKKEKPLKEFYLNAESRDGRHSKCRNCLRAIEEQKKKDRIGNAKSFFDAKFFTLFLLLSASLSAFSQVADTTQLLDLSKWGRAVSTAEGIPIGLTTGISTSDFVIKPDTLRAIILVTLSPNGIAHARMGFVVISEGKPPVYLDCRKRALRWPVVGWDWREADKNYKLK